MYYGFEPSNDGKERHAELLREAEQMRLARQVKADRPQRKDRTRALRTWLGNQLIGWGRLLTGTA